MKLIGMVVAFALIGIVGCGGKTPNIMPAEVGNGGHGVLSEGKVYLYDFYEFGIHNKVKIKVPTENERGRRFIRLRKRLASTFSLLNFPLDHLTAKLEELNRIDPLLTHTLLEAIELYSWTVLDTTFESLEIEGNILKLKKEDFVLLANRVGRDIRISGPYWQLLNEENKVGLLIHEAIYSLLPPQEVQLAKGAFAFRQDAIRVRQITRVFFRSEIQQELSSTGLSSQHISPNELPFLHAKMAMSVNEAKAASKGSRYTSTFFLRKDSRYRGLISPDIVGLVGAVSIEVPVQHGIGIKVVFTPNDPEFNERLILACQQWSDSSSNRLQIDVVFQGSSAQEDTVELRFKTYQGPKGPRTYLAHSRTRNPHRVPINEFNREFDPKIAGSLMGQAAQGFFKGGATELERNQQELEMVNKRKQLCMSNLSKTIPDSFDMVLPYQELESSR